MNDESTQKMQPVVNRLRELSYDTVKPLLDAHLQETQGIDPSVGIVLVNLPDEPLTIDGLVFRFHGARVLPHNPGVTNYVNPHYHLIGEEPYLILAGDDGEMNLGVVKDRSVAWKEPRKVKAGDLIEVKENEVHSLRNLGDTSLDFVFACPDKHLENKDDEHPEGDRYFTSDLVDGIPPWYPK